MGFSDRVLGKKNMNGGPHIESVSPVLALAGGEVRIAGSGLRPPQWQRPRVQFGEVEGGVVVSSDSFLVARVPEGAQAPNRFVTTILDGTQDDLRWERVEGGVWVQT